MLSLVFNYIIQILKTVYNTLHQDITIAWEMCSTSVLPMENVLQEMLLWFLDGRLSCDEVLFHIVNIDETCPAVFIKTICDHTISISTQYRLVLKMLIPLIEKVQRPRAPLEDFRNFNKVLAESQHLKAQLALCENIFIQLLVFLEKHDVISNPLQKEKLKKLILEDYKTVIEECFLINEAEKQHCMGAIQADIPIPGFP